MTRNGVTLLEKELIVFRKEDHAVEGKGEKGVYTLK